MSSAISLIQKNVNLAPYNTLHISATASRFLEVESEEALIEILKTDTDPSEIFVLGGGSNVLFTDNFEGLILHMAITGKEVVRRDDDHVLLKIGAGENWHQAVRYCVEKGWGGIENLSLIPGTVGAAPIQNIGAYGVELEEVFESLTAIEIATGKRRVFGKENCDFAYRHSIFKGALKGCYAVTDVTLKLSRQTKLNTSYGAIKAKLDEKGITNPGIKDISDVVIEIRNSKLPDPNELANAGSFFKNPVIRNGKYDLLKTAHPSMPGYPMDDGHTKVPAGWLIEQTGWKGKVVGSVGTYRQQALVIVNHGNATGREIMALATQIQESVYETFDIKLTPEVNIVE